VPAARARDGDVGGAFVEDLPKTVSGKIQRNVLREQARTGA
jgi:acyl-coenzyme A synthetase/AMP-(fatty) acid ligase